MNENGLLPVGLRPKTENKSSVLRVEEIRAGHTLKQDGTVVQNFNTIFYRPLNTLHLGRDSDTDWPKQSDLLSDQSHKRDSSVEEESKQPTSKERSTELCSSSIDAEP
jgi:hypothetical protein